MENANNRSGGNSFSAFIMGMLVGGFIVFLLATKKGKRILKAISEEGFDKVTGIIEKAEKSVDFDEAFEEEEEEIVPKKRIVVREETGEKPKAKRFFRGISRRLN